MEYLNFWRLCEVCEVMQYVDRTIECVDQMYFCTIVWIEEEMDRYYSDLLLNHCLRLVPLLLHAESDDFVC